MKRLESLLSEIHTCTICKPHLPHGVRPVLQAHPLAKILIAGQAPGRKVHESGIPFDDASGDRLRQWMGIEREVFYDQKQIAILPMGFCYPGSGESGDLPPRTECAPAWRAQILEYLPNLELTLLIGQYAQKYHLKSKYSSLTESVKAWQTYSPNIIPLPHPSPRNNIWISKNRWFETDLLPVLKQLIQQILT